MAVISASDVRDWQDIASSSFVPLRCRGVSDSFSATLDVRHLSPALSLSEVKSGSVNVRRTSALATRSESDDLLLSIQMASSGRISQHGRDAIMTPGTAVLYETNRPYEIDHRLPGQHQLIARVKRAALRLPADSVSQACGRLIGGAEPRLRIFSSYLTSLFEESERLGPGARQEMSEIAVDLLAALLRERSGSPLRSNENLLAALKSFVRDNLHSPGLSVETLAEQHHVSVRAVYDAFAPTGEPPGAYVRKARLKKAASLLSNPGSGRRTVGSIAAECGYTDPSTFTRAFRRRYGVVPTNWTPGT
ncbi:helix-turn-helix domain-containing protein [Arthrobacter sp.]|uniref:AraC-like ligand-binding domain-containing protein n=1 Tax=Arthrobacter sp. TaxID=1667 RepID=UPI00339A4BB2